MRRIKTVIGVLIGTFCVAGLVRGQAPILDSVAIDEDSSILLCYGIFSISSPATVHIADTTLGVLSQSDTLIRATMPMTGHGASGPVTVQINGSQSASLLITYLHFELYVNITYYESDGGDANADYRDYVNVRGYFQNILNPRNFITILPSRSSTFSHSRGGSSGIHGSGYGGPTFDSTGIYYWPCTILFDPTTKSFQIDQACLACFYPCNPIVLNNLFGIVGYTSSGQMGPGYLCDINQAYEGGYYNFGLLQTDSTEFPPSENDAVNSPPAQSSFSASLIEINGSLNIALSSSSYFVRITIFDILGHPMRSVEQPINSATETIPISVTKFIPGEYIARIQCGNEIQSLRFFKAQ